MKKKHAQYWLMKSEPHAFSIVDLKKRKRWHWDGVRNYAARNYMRDAMQIGDMVIFYHSSADPAGPAGIAMVDSLPYPDFTQFDTDSPYYDPKASTEKPIWHMVDVAFVKQFSRIISRDELRASRKLTDMLLWKRNRLSITPLTEIEFDTITKIAAKQ